jgi:hypothetical protein
MPLIPPPTNDKPVPYAIRLAPDVAAQLEAYCEMLGDTATASYVIEFALKSVFKRDNDFAAYRANAAPVNGANGTPAKSKRL